MKIQWRSWSIFPNPVWIFRQYRIISLAFVINCLFRGRHNISTFIPQRHNMASKQCETYGDDRKENDSRKILYNWLWNGQTELKKWGEKKGGWEFSLEGAKPLAQRASKRWRRSTATAPISVSGGPDAREYHSVPHFFFLSLSPLCIFSPYFSSLPLLSALLFTVATTADICVAVIEQHCFRKNLL